MPCPETERALQGPTKTTGGGALGACTGQMPIGEPVEIGREPQLNTYSVLRLDRIHWEPEVILHSSMVIKHKDCQRIYFH